MTEQNELRLDSIQEQNAFNETLQRKHAITNCKKTQTSCATFAR